MNATKSQVFHLLFLEVYKFSTVSKPHSYKYLPPYNISPADTVASIYFPLAGIGQYYTLCFSSQVLTLHSFLTLYTA